MNARERGGVVPCCPSADEAQAVTDPGHFRFPPRKDMVTWPSFRAASLSVGLAVLLALPSPGVALATLKYASPMLQNSFSQGLNAFSLAFASRVMASAGAAAGDQEAEGVDVDSEAAGGEDVGGAEEGEGQDQVSGDNDTAGQDGGDPVDEPEVGEAEASAGESEPSTGDSADGGMAAEAGIPVLALLSVVQEGEPAADEGDVADGETPDGEALDASADDSTDDPSDEADDDPVEEAPAEPAAPPADEGEPVEPAEPAEVVGLPETIEEQSADLFVTIEIPSQQPSLQGFDFQGWTDDEDSEEVRYIHGGGDGSDGMPAGFITLECENPDVVLYAVWEEDADEGVDLPISGLFPEDEATEPDTQDDPAVQPGDDDAIVPDPAPLPAGDALNAALKGIAFADTDEEEPSILADDWSIASITFGSLADYAEIIAGLEGEAVPEAEEGDFPIDLLSDAANVDADALAQLEGLEPMASVDEALIFRVERPVADQGELTPTENAEAMPIENAADAMVDALEPAEEPAEEPAPLFDVYVLSETGRFEAGRSLTRLFSSMRALESVSGLECIDASDTSLMMSMFWGCESLKSVDFGAFSTQSAQALTFMFWDCPALERLDLSSFDTSGVTDWQDMFAGCDSLSEVVVGEGWTLGDPFEDEYAVIRIADSGKEARRAKRHS